MKALRKITVMLLIIALAFSGAAFAATPEEIADATYDGMVWLANQQKPDGSWGNVNFNNDQYGRTGLALLKFETHALNDSTYDGPFDPTYEFSDEVEKGMNYLLSTGAIVSISPQPAGNPDSNGNGTGITILPGTHHEIYVTSIALMAVVASGEPDRVVTSGPFSGMTLGLIAQEMVDYLAWAQNESPPSRGAWGYQGNNITRSDNSISGYAAMGLAFAEHPVYGFECDIPQFVKDELSIWIDYIQNDSSGGSGYDSPTLWVDLMKTGNLLQQMAFVGDTIADQRVQDAIAYIEANWNQPIGGGLPYVGWRGPTSNYQATFTLMKGLQAHGVETLDILPGPVTIDWFDDIADQLLVEQLGDNSWPRAVWDSDTPTVLSTTWALLTLQRVAPPPPVRPIDINIKPGSDPNSVNPKPKGVLPVAILGSEDFDVMTVDCETIKITMEGKELEFAPLRCAYEDVQSDPPVYDPDGYMDIIMHFSMKDIVELLGSEPEGEIELIITGEDMDGYAFMGTDVIRIVPKGKK